MGLQTSAVVYSVRLAKQLHGYTERMSTNVGNAEKTLIIKSQTRRILATTLIGIIGGMAQICSIAYNMFNKDRPYKHVAFLCGFLRTF